MVYGTHRFSWVPQKAIKHVSNTWKEVIATTIEMANRFSGKSSKWGTETIVSITIE